MINLEIGMSRNIITATVSARVLQGV